MRRKKTKEEKEQTRAIELNIDTYDSNVYALYYAHCSQESGRQ